MAPKRQKLLLIVAVLAGSGLALLAWTQTWVDVQVSQAAATTQLSVTGSTAAPAVTALALAGLALAGALTIAGPVIRVVLGILAVLLGFSVFIAALAPIIDPAAASAPAVTAVTGVAGRQAVHTDIALAVVTAWPWVALLGAVLVAAAGIGILATARRWPGSTDRYQARLVPVGPATGAPTASGVDNDVDTPPGTDAVGDWDQLSRGDDPTA